jgi:hypothetical protein
VNSASHADLPGWLWRSTSYEHGDGYGCSRHLHEPPLSATTR